MGYGGLIFVALLLDVLFGDPRWFPHPVRGIGWLCQKGEAVLRHTIKNELVGGLLLVLLVVSITIGTVWLPLYCASFIHPVVEVIVAVFIVYTGVALRDLIKHSNAVYLALVENHDITLARKEVGMIVGRDTNELDEEGVSRACIETVAENMVDGITAPLFWGILAGFMSSFLHLSPIGATAIGVFFYKAINTMDSMVGYKNEQYLNFGRAAAKIDDVVNYLPARISGICLIVAAFFTRLDYGEAARVFIKDRLQHSSPNAGHTEAATAGALNIRLGGPSYYFGKIVEKPYMGEGTRVVEPQDIKKTNRLVTVGVIAFLAVLLSFYEFVG